MLGWLFPLGGGPGSLQPMTQLGTVRSQLMLPAAVALVYLGAGKGGFRQHWNQVHLHWMLDFLASALFLPVGLPLSPHPADTPQRQSAPTPGVPYRTFWEMFFQIPRKHS